MERGDLRIKRDYNIIMTNSKCFLTLVEHLLTSILDGIRLLASLRFEIRSSETLHDSLGPWTLGFQELGKPVKPFHGLGTECMLHGACLGFGNPRIDLENVDKKSREKTMAPSQSGGKPGAGPRKLDELACLVFHQASPSQPFQGAYGAGHLDPLGPGYVADASNPLLLDEIVDNLDIVLEALRELADRRCD